MLSTVFSAVAVMFALAMMIMFVGDSLPVWKSEGFRFVTGKAWSYRNGCFGISPMIYGTVTTSMIAITWAVPVGLGASIFCSEYAPKYLRQLLKITIELLAGIPSVVYGLLGVIFLRNWVYRLLAPFDPLSGDSVLTAGLLLGAMILPTIMSLSDDALCQVSHSQRAAAHGLGLTRAEVIWSVCLPQARAGIFAAVLLGLGRALGETIGVFLVVGRQDNQWNPFSFCTLINPGQTLTSKLGSAEVNIALGDPLHWAAIAGLGVILFVLTYSIVTIGSFLAHRKGDNA